MNRLHRRIALHYANPRSRPTKCEVRIEALAGHGVIAGAARVIEREHDLRNSGACHGLHHFGARANDSSALSLRPHHESGDILKIDQRHSVPLRVLDEVRHFTGRLGVNDSADARPAFSLEESAAIGDYSHGTPK